MIIFLIILAIILFIPIPLIIDLKYENNIFFLYIYKIGIDTSKILRKKSTQLRIEKAKKKLSLIDVKNILSVWGICKIKPRLLIRFNLDFGLDDAALTGFAYGLIWCIYPFMNNILEKIFNVKKRTIKINPHFNEKLLKFHLHSIIVTSLAKTIYIILFIFIRVNKNY